MTRRGIRLLAIALAAYWLTIFTLTHIPPVRISPVQVSDKLEHFAAYFLLTILLNVLLGTRFRLNRDWLTLAIVLSYGAIDEWLQGPIGRDCDLQDWFADAAGAAAAIAVCGLVRSVIRGRTRSPQSEPETAGRSCGSSG